MFNLIIEPKLLSINMDELNKLKININKNNIPSSESTPSHLRP
jgi:hypothetical protein